MRKIAKSLRSLRLCERMHVVLSEIAEEEGLAEIPPDAAKWLIPLSLSRP